eukprot:GGOE01012173.1.p1 GENE.GGOE01012173.1~~GGOE01012173.1.p1  ORF type:complete len:253 (+),score=65.35 GGOE01012173.1:70-759(+)
MATNDQYNSYLKSGENFSSWYKAKAKELEVLQKPSATGSHLTRHRTGDSHLSDAPVKEAAPTRKAGAHLDTLMLGDYKPQVLQGTLRPRNLVPAPPAHIQASLAQAQASLSQLPPLHHSRRSEGPPLRDTSGPKAEASVKDTPEVEQALAESRTRRQVRQLLAESHALPAVREPMKAAPAAPTPSANLSPGISLWQRRHSPTISPLEEIRRQKESEAAQEEALLRRARG